MKIIRNTIFFVAFATIFFSCTKEVETNNEESAPIAYSAPEIKVDNGILVFESTSSLNQFSNLLSQAGSVELNNWESSVGFKSLGNLMDEHSRTISDYYNALFNDGYTENEIIEMINNGVIAQYPTLTYELISEGSIIETTFNNDPSLEFVKNNLPIDSRIVDVDGVVLVGDTLYQYFKDGYKFMPNATTNDIDLLKKTEVDESSMSAILVKKNANSLKSTNITYLKQCFGLISDSKYNENCWSTGCQSIQSQIKYKKQYWNSGTSVKVYFEMYTNNTTRQRWPGVWITQNFGVTATGNCNYEHIKLQSNGSYSGIYGGVYNITESGTSYIKLKDYTSYATYSHNINGLKIYDDHYAYHYDDAAFTVCISTKTNVKVDLFQNRIFDTEKIHQ